MNYVLINGKKFAAEIAQTVEEQQRGLMTRKEPIVMAFPYEQPKVAKFWMKNTPAPLDVIFCQGGKIVDIFRGEPYSEKRFGPTVPCDLVVEFPADTASKNGWSGGDSVELRYDIDSLAKRFALQLGL